MVLTPGGRKLYLLGVSSLTYNNLMKCIIVAAISSDGFIADDDNTDPASWTSAEDKAFFRTMLARHPLHIMGLSTYLAHSVRPQKNTLRIVLTHTPEKYRSLTVPSQLEFYSLAPKQFKDKYKDKFKECLVLGGGVVYSDFLEAGIIDEVYLTVEPIIHKKGLAFLRQGLSLEKYGLTLQDEKLLNKRGARLLQYSQGSGHWASTV
jgi:dihydrofolate reductase